VLWQLHHRGTETALHRTYTPWVRATALDEVEPGEEGQLVEEPQGVMGSQELFQAGAGEQRLCAGGTG
jgi:hypothetical protein